MLEAKEGCAALEDTDEDTFLRFSQYLYTGDYTTADPNISSTGPVITTIPPSNEAPPDLVEEVIEQAPYPPEAYSRQPYVDFETNLQEVSSCWHGWQSKDPLKSERKKRDKAKPVSSKKSKLWKSFKRQRYDVSKPSFQVSKNRDPCEDDTSIFLGHARLYVFAEKYDIDSLKSLSLQKLHQVLIKYSVCDERLEDIIDLIQYSYSNTADLPGSVDKLRQLVISYAACVVEDLAWTPRFYSLLEKCGSAAKDLVVQMLQRLD